MDQAVPPSAENFRHPLTYWGSYVLFVLVASVLLIFRSDLSGRVLLAAWLATILGLLLTDPLLFRRWRWYPYLYFPAQAVLIQILGLQQTSQDIWGLLYAVITLQALYYLPFRTALFWGGAFGLSFILTLLYTMGGVTGPTLGLTTLSGSVLLCLAHILYSQAEAARRASQTLLTELQQAHTRLQTYAAKVQELAALQERDRLAHQLHDSVSQSIFAIALLTQSTRILLDQNPVQVPAQLDQLQEMTSSALAQMRSLIAQWRPK